MSITIVAAAELQKASKLIQKQALVFVDLHEIDSENCFAIAHEPGNGFVADQLTFSLYDLRDGEKYADESGQVVTYQVQRDLIGDLPTWWAQVAKAQAP